ncbi:glycosyltransferase family 4 protein [Aquisediminimonas profunda]|uniref:glycosyltransferase family 4 protein n=1 Tax=Aquisediminimonas profunda TaxID=1550733 RepID=UPI001C627360|nr:glycosyltransferase family 4 protein [Aquisediminimonas profunda]
MTHYPRVALTFISGEIDAMERMGQPISPVALNLPETADLASEEAHQRQAATFYLKGSRSRLAVTVAIMAALHPLAMIATLLIAIRSARLDLNLILRRIAHFCYASLTAKYCRANNIRHLHAHFGQTPATIAWLACEILNRTSDKETSWSFTIHGFQDFVDDAVARLDLKAASAAFIICISDYTKSQLCRVTDPQFWNRYRVIRCGIDLTAFPMRTEMPDRAVPRIVSVARLSPEKGHLILLNALKSLADEGTHAELQIIGAGPFEPAIRREGERLGLEDRIIYSGELLPADVARELGDADVFCLPSFSEGLPVSVMEAMAIGVPVVSTWISGIPELAINETNALIVPASNTEALAGALKRVITNGQLRETLARNARTAVERMHDITTNSEMLFREFQSVLNTNEAMGVRDNASSVR